MTEDEGSRLWVFGRVYRPRRRERKYRHCAPKRQTGTTLAPERGRPLLQQSAQTDRRDLHRQPLRIGLDGDATQGRWPVRRLEARARDLAQKTRERLVLVHADDAVEVAGHTDIGDEGGASLQDAVIGGRHMRVRADDEARPSIAEVAHCLLLAGRLAMEVDDDRVRAVPQHACG